MVTNDNSNVEGFVLREFSYKESSKIIEIFSKDMGKISIIAKGVLNKKNPNLSSTQRFVKASYNLYKSGEKFFGIRDASLLKSYSKSNKNFDIISFLFNNESFINGLLENLKKELMEVIFSDNLSLFKKSIFIQGVFTYTNLILSNNTSMSNEEKNKIMQEIVEISNLLAENSMEDIKRYTN